MGVILLIMSYDQDTLHRLLDLLKQSNEAMCQGNVDRQKNLARNVQCIHLSIMCFFARLINTLPQKENLTITNALNAVNDFHLNGNWSAT